MQLKSFQYFVTIAEKPTLSAAAEALFISQPALSQQIRKMEEELGAQLLDRSGHRLTLTPAGEAFLQCGRRILQTYEGMRMELKLLQSAPQATARFGISPFYGQHYLPKLLPNFMRDYPHVKVDIVEAISEELEERLLAGDLDFCALPLYPENELINYETIYQEEIVIALPRHDPLNDHYPPRQQDDPLPTIDLALLKNEAFIGLKKNQKFSYTSLRLCREAGFVPKIVCETLNWETVHMMIASGLGVGFVPRMLMGSITDPEVCPCYYQLPSHIFRAYAIATRPGAVLSPAARAMIESFRESFQHM